MIVASTQTLGTFMTESVKVLFVKDDAVVHCMIKNFAVASSSAGRPTFAIPAGYEPGESLQFDYVLYYDGAYVQGLISISPSTKLMTFNSDINSSIFAALKEAALEKCLVLSWPLAKFA